MAYLSPSAGTVKALQTLRSLKAWKQSSGLTPRAEALWNEMVEKVQGEINFEKKASEDLAFIPASSERHMALATVIESKLEEILKEETKNEEL